MQPPPSKHLSTCQCACGKKASGCFIYTFDQWTNNSTRITRDHSAAEFRSLTDEGNETKSFQTCSRALSTRYSTSVYPCQNICTKAPVGGSGPLARCRPFYDYSQNQEVWNCKFCKNCTTSALTLSDVRWKHHSLLSAQNKQQQATEAKINTEQNPVNIVHK